MGHCITSGALPSMQKDKRRQCRPRHIPIDQAYILGPRIGEGTSATVRSAVVKGSGKRVAVKVFRKSLMAPGDVEALLNEATLLQQMRRPDILRVSDVVEDPYRYYVVMDLLNGDLFERIVDKGSYCEGEARVLMRNVLRAVAHLHDNDIVHRDLKPENLLMRSDRDDVSVTLGDFGFATHVEGDQGLTYPCGTQNYAAPEILKREAYGKAVDLWSLGVVMFVVLGGYQPFAVLPTEPRRRLLERIKRGVYAFDAAVWGRVSDDAKDLISRMLTVDPSQRITAREALAHPWLAQVMPKPAVDYVTDEPLRCKTPMRRRVQAMLSTGVSTLLHKIKAHEQNAVKVLIKAQ